MKRIENKNAIQNTLFEILKYTMGVTFVATLFAMGRVPSILGVNKVQKGFIPPSQLEIKVDDLDWNGEYETYIVIAGKQYKLLYEDGKPVISDYKSKVKSDTGK